MVSDYEVKLAYATNSIQNLVVEHWTCFVNSCEAHLILRVREQRIRSTTEPTMDPVIAAAAGASDQAEIDHHKLCFCYCDSASMEVVRVQCCQQTYHCQCLLAHLAINSQCAYCCSADINIAGVLALPTINRSEVLSPIMSPPRQATRDKRDLQSFLMDNTPLRSADQHRAESQEKKRDRQLDQAKKMIRTQGKDIASKGGAPGAVVTVKCDYCAVSHLIGIVGVIYKMGNYGRARIATIAGNLSTGTKKSQWWIPSDQYVVRYGANKEANIPPELMLVRDAILDGTFNLNDKAPKCTIQQAHQLIIQAVSSCRKSKCNCVKGACQTRHCGCIKKASNVQAHALATETVW